MERSLGTVRHLALPKQKKMISNHVQSYLRNIQSCIEIVPTERTNKQQKTYTFALLAETSSAGMITAWLDNRHVTTILDMEKGDFRRKVEEAIVTLRLFRSNLTKKMSEPTKIGPVCKNVYQCYRCFNQADFRHPLHQQKKM